MAWTIDATILITTIHLGHALIIFNGVVMGFMGGFNRALGLMRRLRSFFCAYKEAVVSQIILAA